MMMMMMMVVMIMMMISLVSRVNTWKYYVDSLFQVALFFGVFPFRCVDQTPEAKAEIGSERFHPPRLSLDRST